MIDGIWNTGFCFKIVNTWSVAPGKHAVRKDLASPNKKNMRSTTFTVVDAFDIKGRGVVIVGDKAFLDFLEIKQCDVEITIPTGDVLRCIAFKEWLLPSSTPHPDDTEAFFVRGRSKSEIPIGSVVKVTQA
jgi:hypothetical protein